MLLKIIEQDLKTHKFLNKEPPIFIEMDFETYHNFLAEIIFTIKDAKNPYNEIVKVLLEQNVKGTLKVFGLEIKQ